MHLFIYCNVYGCVYLNASMGTTHNWKAAKTEETSNPLEPELQIARILHVDAGN